MSGIRDSDAVCGLSGTGDQVTDIFMSGVIYWSHPEGLLWTCEKITRSNGYDGIILHMLADMKKRRKTRNSTHAPST